MSYSPTTTWATGNILQAAEVQGELDLVRAYISQVPTNAIEAKAWVDTKHIVRGEYDALLNQARYCSGMYDGVQVRAGQAYTYVTLYNSLRGGTAGATWVDLPGTSLTLDVRRAVNLNINWWMSAKSPDRLSGGAAGRTLVSLWVGITSGAAVELSEELTSVHVGNLGVKYRQPLGGFYQGAYPVGTLKIGLKGMSDTSKAIGFAWGVSVEAFAL